LELHKVFVKLFHHKRLLFQKNLLGIILKAISDTADMDAGFNFDEFLESSAKNSASFLMKVIEKIK